MPGSGKSNAIKVAGRQFLANLTTIHLAPDDITEASFYERLEASTGSYIRDELPETHLSMAAFVDEWAIFVKENARQFMSFLSKLYDNPEILEHSTRHSGTNILERPSLVMLGGVTPKQLKERFSDQALEGGFPARSILIYDGDVRQHVPASLKVQHKEAPAQATASPAQRALHRKLLHDLEYIHTMAWEYEWTPEAADVFVKWYDAGLPPIPRDPKLKHYNTRRVAHASKLCMIFAAARRDEPFIEPQDVQSAKELLTQAETKMPRAMQSLGQSKHIDALKIARYVVELEFARSKRPVPEHKIRQAIITEVEPNMVGFVLENLVKSHWVRKDTDLSTGTTLYVPVERERED